MSLYLSKITGFFGSFSSDMLFLIVTFIVFSACSMYFGRGRMISFVLAFYPATLLFRSFPFMEKLTILSGDKLILLNHIAIFLLFLIPLNIIINRYIFSASEYSGSSNIFRSLGLGLLATILLLLFSYQTLNFDALHNFAPGIDNLFSSSNKLFYANLAPLALLAAL